MRSALTSLNPMRRAFRILYAVIALGLFLSLIALGAALLLYPELSEEYPGRVLLAIVLGAVALLVFDLI